jgi:uncharacterized membrane protein YjfL (UPF0719 family)
MVCITNCALGVALIIATIITSLASKSDPVFQNYLRTLDPKQIYSLEEISNNRASLYLQGTILGVILIILLTVLGYKQLSPFTNGCTFVVIVLLTQYFYYILMPKKDWMLNHLKTQDQIKGWLSVYRHMSLRWHFGLVIGLIGYFLLGRGVAM